MTNNELHTDKDFFARIADNDETAFALLFNKYSDLLYTHAFKILKSEFWAEEIVQDVFIQLWSGRTGLRDVSSPAAYLFRMVANKSLDRIRKQEVEVRMQYFISRQALPESEDNTRLDKIDQLLLEAIDTLPAQRKIIYRLKYHQDLSYQEIAGRLNITHHTVRNQLTKALHSIRSFIAERGDFLILLCLFLKLR